jgi:uncharacterized BrkB/YihY/UPF0761 family membrane protein
MDLAAQMSFYFVLSIFPFFLVVAAIVGWLPSTNLWHALVQWITDYLPQGSRHLLFSVILDLTNGYTRFLSAGLLVTLWTASSGFVSLMEALSVAHGRRDTRNFWKKRLIAIIATLVSAIFFLAIFGLASMSRGAAGMLSDHLRALTVSKAAWEIARWLANLLLILLAISLANYFLPDAKRAWRWLTPGTSFVAVTFDLRDIWTRVSTHIWTNRLALSVSSTKRTGARSTGWKESTFKAITISTIRSWRDWFLLRRDLFFHTGNIATIFFERA